MSAIESYPSSPDYQLLNNLPDGVACYQALRDAAGTVTGFRLTYANPLFSQLAPAQYQQPIGELFPTQTDEQTALLERCIRSIETAAVVDHTVYEPNQTAGLSFRIAPYGNGVLVTLRPVSAPSIQVPSRWVDNVLNASLSNTFVYEAIRDESGRIYDFFIRFANQHARQDVMARFGVEAIGNTLLTIYPNSPRQGQFRHCVSVVETGQPIRMDIHYPEIQTWYEVLITKLDDGCIVTSLDITERKQNELHIRQQTSDQERMVQELRQSNENLRQFAQVASHDLQEPLRKIQTFSDILQNQFEDNLSDGERDMTQRIQKSAQRMQMMIKDLLTYSQLAAQRYPFDPISLNEVVEDVISDLEIAIAENGAILHVGTLPTVPGNASRLRQLMQNLLANAMKFRQANQPPVIRIDARPAQPNELPADLNPAGSFWLITVADNGLGFEEKYKDRIFHPFQRLHKATTYSGTGIGLAICQRVAESHGGTIDVSSAPNEGATFKIFLPVYPATT